jgi:hypothetical protein
MEFNRPCSLLAFSQAAAKPTLRAKAQACAQDDKKMTDES